MKKILAFTILCITSIAANSQGDSDYEQKLKTLFKVSGSEKSFEVAIKQTVQMIKGQYASIDEELWGKIENEFLRTSLDDLTGMLVPVYKKHLTEEDLEGVIAFYRTPTGKKYAIKTPVIMGESMEVGQQWGMQIGNALMKKLEEEGY